MGRSRFVPSLPTVFGGCFLLLLVWAVSVVGGQSPECESLKSSATKKSSENDCNCTKPPVCTTCNPVQKVVTCTSGCAYCDAATKSICGVKVYTVIQTTNGVYAVDETWRYTKGQRQGTTISYSWTSASLSCTVSVNDNQTCTSCRRQGICYNVPPSQSPYTAESNVNCCTNLVGGVGATATACRAAPTYYAGPIPLDELAFDDVKNDILAPLAYAHVLCQRGLVVIRPQLHCASATITHYANSCATGTSTHNHSIVRGLWFVRTWYSLFPWMWPPSKIVALLFVALVLLFRA